MIGIIDFNDWELVITNAEPVRNKKHYAAAAKGPEEMLFSEDALALCRINPQLVNTQYLRKLSADPLSNPINDAKNHADLIFHHLLRIKEQSGVSRCVMVISEHYTDQQLGLLAGIAEAAGIEVLSFFNNALRVGPKQSMDFEFLDLGLSHACTTSVVSREGKLATADCQILEGSGFLNLVEGLLYLVAETFLERDRFDVLANGATEQQLFNQIREQLEDCEPDSMSLSVTSNDFNGRVELGREKIQELVRQKFVGLHLDPNRPLILSTRAQRIPFISNVLKENGAQSIRNIEEDFFANYANLEVFVVPNSIQRIATIDGLSESGSPAGNLNKNNSLEVHKKEKATHLVSNGSAWELSHPRWHGFLDEEGLLRPNCQVLVNGSSPRSASINTKDKIHFEGSDFEAIRVEV